MNRIITLLITLLCLGNVCAQNNKKLVVYRKNGAKVEYKLSEIEKVNIEEIVMVNSISLNTTNKELEKGKTLQLSATVLPTNADKRTVSWSSSNKSVATVSSSGLVTAKGAGTATITATAADGSGVSSSATITVPTPSLLPAFTIPSGVTVNFSNTEEYPWDINNNILSPTNFNIDGSNSYFTVTITSENPIILSFDWKVSSEEDYDFLYYTVDNGTETNISGSTSYETKTLNISSGTHKIKFGYRKDSSENGNDDIGWIKNIVIKNNIRVSSITLNSTSVSLSPSDTYQLSASVYPNNATNKTVNWTTSDSNVATVSSTGLVTAKSTGTANITVATTDGSGVSSTATVYVVSPSAPSLIPAFTVPSGVTLTTTTSPTYPWVNNSGTLSPGNSGVHSSDSYFTATITSASSTILSFNWYVSSEQDSDYLYYTVDGGKWTSRSGNTSLYNESISLTAGTHTVRFGYIKDRTGSSGSDIGYISNLVITKNGSSTPTTTHEYVDLGLSVKWATCNVGASKPEHYGDYFAWGETKPKFEYSWSNYLSSIRNDRDCGTDLDPLKDYAYPNNKSIAGTQYDAATKNWGGTWRMPTKEEMDELLTKCKWTWTTLNGIAGYKVEGNGNSIFLPAAGYRYESELNYAGSHGNYRSATPISGASFAYIISFDSKYSPSSGIGDTRRMGDSVRPVCP